MSQMSEQPSNLSESLPSLSASPGQAATLTRSRSQSVIKRDLPATTEPYLRSQSPPVLIKKRHSAHVTPQDISAWQLHVPPERPPRNPARSMATPAPRRALRPNTATGAREIVTPWELHPAPNYSSSTDLRKLLRPSSSKDSSSKDNLALSDFALRRRKSTGSKPQSPKPKVVKPPSANNDHPVAMAFGFDSGYVPLPVLRPPKSPKSPKSPKVAKTPTKSPAPSTSSLSAPSTSSLSEPPITKLPQTAAAIPAASPSASSSTSSVHNKQAEQTANRLKFSTADRTILEELKRSINARASQFVYKNRSSAIVDHAQCLGWGAQGIGAGKKHHPYTADVMPYPRNYEKEVLDLDVWDTAWAQQVSGSVTWHVFEQPPTKVLDIGCGSGTWIMNCARRWKDCCFVGLDAVPLHPDLQRIGSIDLASRITWTQANFLEGLPFPNEEFDYVHIKRISLGVPEDKWDALFEEITRVMKPGGAFEMLEEDLFFPGKSTDNGDDEVSLQERSEDLPQADQDQDTDSGFTSSGGSRRNSFLDGRYSDEQTWSPTTANTSDGACQLPETRTASRPSFSGREPIAIVTEQHKPAPRSSSEFADIAPQYTRRVNGSSPTNKSPIIGSSPMNKSPIIKSPSAVNLRARRESVDKLNEAPPPLRLKASIPAYPTTGFHLPTRPLSVSQHGKSSAEWMQSMAPTSSPRTFNPGDSGISIDSRHSISYARPSQNPLLPRSPGYSPFLLRSVPKAPNNPRDHSMLEMIYNEMCEARFINLSPLSLLANLIVLHFNTVRTHPPIQFTFPPLPKPSPAQDRFADDDPDVDARDAIIPTPRPSPIGTSSTTPRGTPRNTPHGGHSSADYFGDAQPEMDEKRFLSMRGLLHNSSRYVTLDGTRSTGYSPSNKSAFVNKAKIENGKDKDGLPFSTAGDAALDVLSTNSKLAFNDARVAAVSARSAGLPNTTLRMDLRTLNLHLAVRVSEIIACSEAMWEWVLQYQQGLAQHKAKKDTKSRARSGSGSIEILHQKRYSIIPGGESPAKVGLKAAIAELTRDDFDNLISNFDLDMRDQMCLGQAIEERFSWAMSQPASPRYEKKLFDNAYEQWVNWQEEHPPLRPIGTSLAGASPHRENPPRGKSTWTALGTSSPYHKPSISTNGNVFPGIPPTTKLSRVYRVFVAWKASW